MRFIGLFLCVGGGLSLAACSPSQGNGTGEGALEAELLDSVSAQEAFIADEPLVNFDSYGVDSDGIVLIDSTSKRAFLFEFGSIQSDVEPNFTENLGLTSSPASNDECPAGAMDFANFDGLSLNYQDGVFLGWSLGPSTEGADDAATLDGITIGTTRAEIEALRELGPFEESSLGDEFSVEGVHMLLSGTGPDAKVADMWAGMNCIFR